MKKFLKSKKKKGFTLIELLVVIGIIGVLSLVAAPTIMSKVDDAKEKADISNASSIAMAVKTEIAEGKKLTDGAIKPEALTTLISDYFDGGIPVSQIDKDKVFAVSIAGNKITVLVEGRQVYPIYTPKAET